MKLNLLLLLLVITYPLFGQQSLSEKDVYTIAIDKEYEPYEFLNSDNKADGFIPSLLQEIGKCAEVTFDFLPMTWPEATRALESGKVDLISMIYSPERAKLYEFSKPHCQISQALFRYIKSVDVKDLATLSGLKVGFQENDISYGALGSRGDFTKRLYNSKLEGLLHLNMGEVDAFFCAEQAGIRLISEYKLSNIYLAKGDLFSQDFAFATCKGDLQLIGLLNTHLAELQTSGELKLLTDTWLSGMLYTPNWFTRNQTLVYIFIGVICASLLLLLFLAQNLRHNVQVKIKKLKANQKLFHTVEKTLHDSETLLSTMAENYPNSYVYIIENDLTIGFSSGREFKKQNLDPYQFVGMHLDQVFGEKSAFIKEKYLETFNGTETQFQLFIDNQHQLFRTVPLANSEGSIARIMVVVENITERKQAEMERLALETQLHQSQKLEAVGTLVGGISHELNNILQSMLLYGGLVQEDLPDDNLIQSNLQHMLDDVERAKDIVKQVLTFSRKARIEMKPQFLHELIREVAILERASLPANIKIIQDINLNSGLVLCDKTQIHQIMINLCNNAQYAMEEKGGILTVSLNRIMASIDISDPETDVLELKVSDTGHGIDPPALERIFDPFFTTKQSGEGTGLGLSVIHGIVKMMKGRISVTSKVGKGTTFRILFPLTDISQNLEPVKSATAPNDIGKSILLVDDEYSIRQATQVVLTRRGYKVACAKNGKQAFQLFKANPGKYDLIITDKSMPKMSGIELTEAVRNTKSDIPILLSTGQVSIVDKEEFKAIGITAFIQKPWTANELIERIQKIE